MFSSDPHYARATAYVIVSLGVTVLAAAATGIPVAFGYLFYKMAGPVAGVIAGLSVFSLFVGPPAAVHLLARHFRREACA